MEERVKRTMREQKLNRQSESESSQYVLQFIWSFIKGSETERGRRGAEQKQSRDFQEKRCVAKINKYSFTPSLCSALSRHTIRGQAGAHTRTHKTDTHARTHTHTHTHTSLHLLPRNSNKI